MKRNAYVYFAAWIVLAGVPTSRSMADHIKDLQTQAIQQGHSNAAHWGGDPKNYTAWGSHSNRLIPIYTFGTRNAGNGIDLTDYTRANSPYRNEQALRQIYGYVPEKTVYSKADYCDQTNIADIQRAALLAGKKHIFLVVFDGMDWQTTRAAAIHNRGKVSYQQGRGTGLHFLDYTANGTSQFGSMVTSPVNAGMKTNVDTQEVSAAASNRRGGYDPTQAGFAPWSQPSDLGYLISKPKPGVVEHAYADSASTATSMTTGSKTYNGAINVDRTGAQLTTIAHFAQQRGLAVGAVSSVPISHATPAAAYAHNVNRGDYQDLTRDMVGLPSVAHSDSPLPGLDVVIGGGFGVMQKTKSSQGSNFVVGNQYITDSDLTEIDVQSDGKLSRYVVCVRTPAVNGNTALQAAATAAAKNGTRLFGMFGVGKYKGHLPYQTADGQFDPAPGRSGRAEQYSQADRDENPTLAQMTVAALTVLGKNPKGSWLMLEAGDVDWANHDNNLDTSIGAVNSGDAAVKVITDWVEKHSNWKDSLLIVTADHGHYLVLEKPESLIPTAKISE